MKQISILSSSFFRSQLFVFLVFISLTIPSDSIYAQIGNNSLLNDLTIPSNGQSMRSSSVDLKFDGNGDSKEILPGETLILADLEGPGIINHIWSNSI